MAFLGGLSAFLSNVSNEIATGVSGEIVANVSEEVSSESFIEKIGAFFSGISNSLEEFSNVFFANYVGWFMVLLAVIAVINAIFAFKCADIASKRGYDEDKYFTLGFIFGIFAFIRAKCLKNRLNAR